MAIILHHSFAIRLLPLDFVWNARLFAALRQVADSARSADACDIPVSGLSFSFELQGQPQFPRFFMKFT
jgi:hypothetical protein